MKGEKFMVLVVKYDETQSEATETMIKKLSESVNQKLVEIKCIYQGSETKLVSALESILSLADKESKLS